jgi:hypothetical protein
MMIGQSVPIEEASSTSGNTCLTKGAARRKITQNCQHRDYGHDPADLRNAIDTRRHNRARMSSSHRRSPA